MKPTVIFFASALAAACLGSLDMSAADKPDLPLQQLHQEVLTDTRVDTSSGGKPVVQFRNVPTTDVQATAARFKTILQKEDFTATEGVAARIKMCADIAERLVPSLKDSASGQDSQLLDSLNAFMDKVNGNIDPKWRFLPVSANVAPPSGGGLVFSGMDPNAISDPQQKKDYQDRIAAEQNKQFVNAQQTQLRQVRGSFLFLATGLVAAEGQSGWTTADLYKHFAKDDSSKAILTGHLRKTGHLK